MCIIMVTQEHVTLLSPRAEFLSRQPYEAYVSVIDRPGTKVGRTMNITFTSVQWASFDCNQEATRQPGGIIRVEGQISAR